MVLSLFSCEKNDENSKIQNSSEEGDLYLRALEFPDEESYINIKRNDNYYPVKLYFSNSLENDLINSEDIISETEYSEDGKVRSYKQQKSDLEDPLLYIYEKVMYLDYNLIMLEKGVNMYNYDKIEAVKVLKNYIQKIEKNSLYKESISDSQSDKEYVKSILENSKKLIFEVL